MDLYKVTADGKAHKVSIYNKENRIVVFYSDNHTLTEESIETKPSVADIMYEEFISRLIEEEWDTNKIAAREIAVVLNWLHLPPSRFRFGTMAPSLETNLPVSYWKAEEGTPVVVWKLKNGKVIAQQYNGPELILSGYLEKDIKRMYPDKSCIRAIYKEPFLFAWDTPFLAGEDRITFNRREERLPITGGYVQPFRRWQEGDHNMIAVIKDSIPGGTAYSSLGRNLTVDGEIALVRQEPLWGSSHPMSAHPPGGTVPRQNQVVRKSGPLLKPSIRAPEQ